MKIVREDDIRVSMDGKRWCLEERFTARRPGGDAAAPDRPPWRVVGIDVEAGKSGIVWFEDGEAAAEGLQILRLVRDQLQAMGAAVLPGYLAELFLKTSRTLAGETA